MDAIVKQLGGLFLGAVPTIVLFLLLVVAYGLLVRRPLDRVLGERRKRTSGAVDEARAAIGAAEEKTAMYEDKLRAARAELFNAREQRVKQWAAERERAVHEARTTTQAKVAEARLTLEQSAAAGRQQIERMSGELSAQILKAVLPAGVSGSGAAQ